MNLCLLQYFDLSQKCTKFFKIIITSIILLTIMKYFVKKIKKNYFNKFKLKKSI